jgi:hypothetical protein
VTIDRRANALPDGMNTCLWVAAKRGVRTRLSTFSHAPEDRTLATSIESYSDPAGSASGDVITPALPLFWGKEEN